MGFLPLDFNIDNIKGLFAFSQFVELVTITGSIYIARRFLDKRSFVSLGLQVNKQAFADILIGIAITFVMMGLIYFAEVAAGWLTFESFAWQNRFSPNRDDWRINLFGGFYIRRLERRTALARLSLTDPCQRTKCILGCSHLIQPVWACAPWQPKCHLGQRSGNFLCRLISGLWFLRTGQLWLSIGLHIGWNFFEGVVFGFPVSGLDIYHLIRLQIQGPEIWTGGAFGPEAGLIVLPALGIGAVLIYLYTRNRTTVKEIR